ncbi:hypothetical protein NKDENANG_01538 [Candidatus Entotheonellaceae bacterium PAL068K]
MAQIQSGALPPEDMHKELQKIYAVLDELKAQEDARVASLTDASDAGLRDAGAATEQINWKKSIKKYSIECLECGATFKQLSVRHLKDHDLDARSYRTKYAIPRTQPLSAKDTTAMRKKIVQQSRPWEKAPTYMKAHAHKTGDATTARPKRTKRRSSTIAK